MMDMDAKFLWAEAAATAVYVKNRLPHAALSSNTSITPSNTSITPSNTSITHSNTSITPFEALNGHKPTIKHLQPFGRACFVHIPEESWPPGSKLLARSIEGRFCGYTESTKIYRVWIPSKPNQVYESRDVTFPPIQSDKLTLEMDIRQPLEGSTVKPTVDSDSDSEPLTPIEDLEDRMLQQSISEQSILDQSIFHQQQQTPPRPRAPSPHMPGSFTDDPLQATRRGNRVRKAPE